jgi:hypothetical protein
MESLNGYKVELWEDEIEWDEYGQIIHHPLNSRYFVTTGKGSVSYGHLTFAGHDLDKSEILENIKIYYLEFKGKSVEDYDREEWANILRVEVLNRLSSVNRCWYMSMDDIDDKDIGDATERIIGKRLPEIVVRSEKPFGYGYGFITRKFLEIPNQHLSEIVKYFWSKASPGIPIEGYNMEIGQLERLKQWDARPRDDQLFKEVCDKTFIDFYTFPAEHRYFVFVTNKLNYAELANLIDLADLQAGAKKIGEKISQQKSE